VIVGIGQFARVKLRLEPKVPGTGKLPFSRPAARNSRRSIQLARR